MLSTTSTLKIARLAAGVRLQDAAREIGVPDTLLSKFERLERPVSTRQVEKLAELYECDPDALHGRKPLQIAARPPSMRF